MLANLYADSVPGGLCEPLGYILAEKYPDSLFDLVSEYFQSSERRGDIYELVLPIRDANLPAKRQVKFSSCCISRRDQKSKQVLSALARLDQKRAAYFTLQLLDEFPVEIEEDYEGCPEAELGRCRQRARRRAGWTACCKPHSVSARTAIGIAFQPRVSERQSAAAATYRLALLAAFLNDETVVERTMDDGAGRSTRTPIAVRDFVAVRLAWSVIGHRTES